MKKQSMLVHKLKRLLISMGLAAGVLAMAVQPAAMANGYTAVVEGNNRFACELFNRMHMSGSDSNIFFSPVSLSTALGMTYAGSRGNTAQQMADTMHFTLPQAELHQGFSELSAALGSDGKAYRLDLANALWGQEGFHFEDNFVSLIADNYGGGIQKVDFLEQREESRQIINGWVKDKTAGKIQELLRPDDLTVNTRLVLTNAIYFKGAWKVPFKEKETQTRPFHISQDKTVDVPMMYQMGNFRHAATQEADILELPYDGGDLSMVVLVPRGTMDELAGILTPEQLQVWLAQLQMGKTAVFLPRFQFTARYYLEEPQYLPALGMVDAFSEQDADFSGMTGQKDLYIAHVVHQAMIEVNEAGSEAAASTGVVMDFKSLVPVFRADKPFLFMIMHKPTGAILFMGEVYNPAG